jgi:hypothetical protein
MNILNLNFIKENFTHNQIEKIDSWGNSFTDFQKVSYAWTHGANDKSLGDGLLIYALMHYMRVKTAVCLGSGGGFVPRIMTQARVDLHAANIFEGNSNFSWGDIGVTYVVDALNGIGGHVDWQESDSFFRKRFHPRIIFDTTENAYHNHFVKEDIKIDYLHIDAAHYYENVKQDFELYSKILSPHGIISIHDTDTTYERDYLVSNDIVEQNHYQEFSNGPSKLIQELKESGEWEIFNFFNNGILKTKPSSTGLTILQRCKN